MEMSSVNWSEVLAIFVGFGAFFVYLMSRLDTLKKDLEGKIEVTQKNLNDKIEVTQKNLNDKIEVTQKNLNDKIEGLQKDINRIDSKVSNIEGQITQMTRPKVLPIQRNQTDDELKEN